MSARHKSFLKRAAKLTLAAVIVVSIGKVLTSFVGEVDFSNVNVTWLGLAFLLTLAYRLTNAYGWTFVLRALNTKVSGVAAIRIWITSEACRWLPGSLWSYGSRAFQAKNHGIPAVTAGASLILELLLTITAWCVTAVIGLVFYREAFLGLLSKISWENIPTTAIVLVVSAALLFAGLLYLLREKIKTKLASKLAPIHERLTALKAARPDVGRCVISLGYYVGMCLVNGVAAAMVFRAVLPDSNVPMLAVIGANAAAWLIGFFAIMAPGGLVVREGAMATLLVAWLPAEQAIAAAVIWRFIQIVVEAACMVGVYGEMFLAKRSGGRKVSALN